MPKASIAKNFAPPISSRRGLHLGVWVALWISGGIVMLCDRANSQSNIVPDGTLGNETSVVVPNFQGLPVEAIGGGAARGQNLFHSFQEFNVSTGRGAYFFSPSNDIQNILARVTGINPSQILGTLGTFGNSSPNLFLINSNGIIFGQNASLDVGGSFVATTANAIRLGDTGLFSASQPQTSNLLAINPNALFYNQLSNQGQIVNRSTATTTVLGAPTNGIQVPDGRSLLLVGGDVRSEGGRLFAPGGRVELGGVAQNGTVELSANGNELRLNFPTDVARADVSLTNEAEVNVRAGGGGSIAINARNVEVLGGSKVRAGIASGLGSPESKAGDIEVNTIGTITIAGELSFLGNVVQPGGEGKAGNINITTGSLFVKEGGYFNAATQGRGDAGSVTINARDIVSFDGVGSNGTTSGAVSAVTEGAVGKGGDINITSGSLFVTNGAELMTGTTGQGNAGSIKIRARERVRFDGVGSNGGSSNASSGVAAGVAGNGGDIEITAGSLEVTNGARLIASTFGQGKAGSVRIRTRDTVRFDGVGSNGRSSIATSGVGAGEVGNGGDIEITTGSLSVSNGAYLFASTTGQGNAGSVKITATDTVSFDGVGSNGITSGVSSDVGAEAVGNSGGIEITTGSLSVRNSASLSAITIGRGNAGNVRIRATDTVRFDGGGGVGSLVSQGGVGDGGDIEITTGSLDVSNSAGLSTATFGQGKAGNVRIRATDTVRFDDGGAYSAVGQGAVGDGGDIEITTDSLEVTNGAGLFAATVGQGKAGSVRISATDTVRFDGVASNGASSGAFSTVGSKAVGNGGDIEITAGFLSLSNAAALSTGTFGQGNSGNMKITANGSLSVTNGASLSASTNGQGNAGSVRINVGDTVSFDGVGNNGQASGAFSAAGATAEGKGGDIEITSGSLSLTDAYISSESRGTGIAGDITLSTRQNLQMNRSQVLATTQSGDGGNIRLQVGDILLMRNGSNISTTAGEAGAGGNGGNITIGADFIVAVPKENSDITANAFEGNGGNINITTQGIYGLEYRPQLTPLSDITASSKFGLNGEFQLDLLTNVDPSRGLAQLPTDVIDASQQIDRRCTPKTANQGSSFTITGRGGIPASPNEPLQAESVITPNWVTFNSDAENNTSPGPTTPRSSAPRKFVEAQGWIINEKGQVVLTASAPNVTPHGEWFPEADCNPPKTATVPQS